MRRRRLRRRSVTSSMKPDNDGCKSAVVGLRRRVTHYRVREAMREITFKV
jgi:hypothetical protein